MPVPERNGNRQAEGPLNSERGRRTDRPTRTQVEISAGGQPDKAEKLSDSQVDRQGGHPGDPKTRGPSLKAARRD